MYTGRVGGRKRKQTLLINEPYLGRVEANLLERLEMYVCKDDYHLGEAIFKKK